MKQRTASIEYVTPGIETTSAVHSHEEHSA